MLQQVSGDVEQIPTGKTGLKPEAGLNKTDVLGSFLEPKGFGGRQMNQDI